MFKQRLASAALTSFLFGLTTTGSAEKIRVQSYYGTYKVDGKKPGEPAPSLGKPVVEWWQSPKKADKPYKLAVLLPHLNDQYWPTLSAGILRQAERFGIGAKLMLAGAGRNLGKQVLQLEDVLKNKGQYDGIIIAPVQFHKSKLENVFGRISAAGIPIVSVANDSFTPTINAKITIHREGLGNRVGQILCSRSNKKKSKVLIFPGPKGASWSLGNYRGLMMALKRCDADGNIITLPPVWSNVNDKAQRHLLGLMLAKYQDIDFLVANGVGAISMVTKGPTGKPAPIEKYRHRHPNIKVLSTILLQNTYDHIKSGKILAAPVDFVNQQGMMAVDVIVRILNGEKVGAKVNRLPFRSGPIPATVSRSNIGEWDSERLFGKRDFVPRLLLSPALNHPSRRHSSPK